VSLQTRLTAFANAVGADIKSLKNQSYRRRELGPGDNCVIVGSSNAISTTWGPEFCATWGLTMRNHAIAGAAFTNGGNFLEQLQSASANTAFSNDTVGLVIICDSSNNIRSWNDTGSSTDITTAARNTFSYARTTFPNARVICIPVIWPADPFNDIAGVPGGYQFIWPTALMSTVQMIHGAALMYGVEVVDESWTWLSGLPGVMNTDGSVHPNAAGYTMVAQWLGRHLRGQSTRKDTAWAAIPTRSTFFTNPITATSPPFQWRREGWTVYVRGSLRINVTSSGGYTDFGDMPEGIRPPFNWTMQYRQNGQGPLNGVEIYQNGVLRIWGNLPSGYEFYVNGVYTLS
jgi:hypothetical protein